MMNATRMPHTKKVLFQRADLSIETQLDGARKKNCGRQQELRSAFQAPLHLLKENRELTDGIGISEHEGPYSVLIINSSRDMAKEITFQLSVEIPGCSLMYAPTLQLASCILKRRDIDLVVSDAILPDGNVTGLNDILGSMDNPPDLVVVGKLSMKGAKELGHSGYRLSGFLRNRAKKDALHSDLAAQIEKSIEPEDDEKLALAIKGLGADIRNDLNNPLQEIVAMLFLARAHVEPAAGVDLALTAIEKAAKNMAGIVRGLEDKIRSTVIDDSR